MMQIWEMKVNSRLEMNVRNVESLNCGEVEALDV